MGGVQNITFMEYVKRELVKMEHPKKNTDLFIYPNDNLPEQYTYQEFRYYNTQLPVLIF